MKTYKMLLATMLTSGILFGLGMPSASAQFKMPKPGSGISLPKLPPLAPPNWKPKLPPVSLDPSNLPSRERRISDLNKKYSFVEHQSGFVTRVDAAAAVPLLVSKLHAKHESNSLEHENSGVKSYKHKFGVRYLAYAAADWHNPFHGDSGRVAKTGDKKKKGGKKIDKKNKIASR